MLVLIRVKAGSGDSPVGEYRLVFPGDTSTPQSAIVAMRYTRRDQPHGFVVDSGSVQVKNVGGLLHVDVIGSGLETTEAHRTMMQATFDGVRLESDTTSCTPERATGPGGA